MNRITPVVALLFAAGAALGGAPSVYDTHVVFDNSRARHAYYYSHARAVAPSALETVDGHLPLARDPAHSPPNSLRLRWTAATGGDWRVDLDARPEFGTTAFRGDALIFWAYSEEGLEAADAPRLLLLDAHGAGSPVSPLTGHLPRLAPRTWTRVVLPLAGFRDLFRETTDAVIDLSALRRLVITQNIDDGVPHTLYLDDIRVGDAHPADGPAPASPGALTATGYERHIELEWPAAAAGSVDHYRIYRGAAAGDAFVEVGQQRGDYARYEDFTDAPRGARYRVTAVDAAGRESAPSPVARAATRPMGDEELMTMVQRAQFRYYWDGAHPDAGMALELTPGDPDQVALGSSGFGILALLVGIERGFITRAEGRGRLERIVHFLEHADRFHGAWPHFLDGRTGRVMAVFGKYDDGGDLVETAFLMQGLLAARQYFDRADDAERALRAAITSLWEGVEWDWYRRDPGSDFLYWHWSPDHQFIISHPLIGWNETLIVYLLAIASPAHPVPAELWHRGWASQSELAVAYRERWSRTREGDHYTNGHRYYGIPLEVGEGNGAELFFTQFSFLGFDPRGRRDAYTDYFENNRAIARIQQAYALDNPRHCAGYGADAWGQSAGRHVGGGRAVPADDNCTLVVHAALGSMPYTPEASLRALRHYYRDLGPQLWGAYGFSDSFNERDEWFDEVYAGLNQAQAVVMIENARSGLVWRLFMANAEIGAALERIGFRPEGGAGRP